MLQKNAFLKIDLKTLIKILRTFKEHTNYINDTSLWDIGQWKPIKMVV